MEVLNSVNTFRTAEGWTQEDLALRVGLSRQRIKSIERGKYMLALMFARVLTVPRILYFRSKDKGARHAE